MDRRVKERLVGASILVVLIVLIVPELLSGPAPVPVPAPAPMLSAAPASAAEPVRNVTVDLATSKAPAPEPPPQPATASSPAPHEAPSAAAAGAVDAPATLETAPPAPTSAAAPTKPAALPGRSWAVQLGSFASRANADKLVRQLKAQGFAVYVLAGGSGTSLRYRVRVGPMADRNSAAQAVAKLNSVGHSGTVVPPGP